MLGSLNSIARQLDARTTATTYPWHELARRDVLDVRRKLLERGQPATVRKHMSALRGLVRELYACGDIDAARLTELTVLPRVRGAATPAGRALSNLELKLLVSACDPKTIIGARDGAILALLYGAGLRRQEACDAKWGTLSFSRGNGEIRVIGKGRRARVIPLLGGAREMLRPFALMRGIYIAGPILCDARSVADCHAGLSLRGLNAACVAMARRAGILPFSPHDLRRTFASNLLASSGDAGVVQHLLGHANVSTTMIYDRRSSESARRAVEGVSIPWRP